MKQIVETRNLTEVYAGNVCAVNHVSIGIGEGKSAERLASERQMIAKQTVGRPNTRRTQPQGVIKMHSTESADGSKPSPKVAKGYKRVGMEGFIAKWYDKNAGKGTREQYRTWAKMVAENVAEGDSVLEVAPGPGYLAMELAKRGKYTLSDWISAEHLWRLRKKTPRKRA